MRYILFAAAVMVVACAAKPHDILTTYPVADSVRVVMSPEAERTIDSIATVTRRDRKEQAACVEDYATTQTAQHSWLVALILVGPSNAYDSDSLRVWTRDQKPFCAKGVPNLHTHIIQNEVWFRPSDFDIQQAKDWPDVPFRVVVSVPPKQGGLRVTVYAVR